MKILNGTSKTINTEIDVHYAIQSMVKPKGLPKIIDIGTMYYKGEKQYFATELLGKNLSQIYQLSLGQMSIAQIINLGVQLTHSIESLHRIGYIHNDIKPDNIMVGQENRKNDHFKVYLIDFGLCHKYIKSAR